MKKAVFLILILSLFLISCKTFQGELFVPGEAKELSEEPAETSETAEETTTETEETTTGCTHNENCEWNELCIETKCQKLETFYEVDDTCKRCKFTKVEILTSDGETYNFAPGKGSYTAVSALEWNIISGKEYCQGTKPIIPINILKRNYGKIFSDEVILLQEGQTSDIMTHPTVKSLAFTLKIVKVEESCS